VSRQQLVEFVVGPRRDLPQRQRQDHPRSHHGNR
jgi:hypothetical protein